MISAWDSTRSERTSNDASASAANPLPMWVTNVPTTSYKRKQNGNYTVSSRSILFTNIHNI